MPEIQTCTKCGGTGRIRREDCKTCRGSGKVIVTYEDEGRRRVITPAVRKDKPERSRA